MEIQHFFDESTSTLSYVVYDPGSRDGLVIDPVLNYEPQGSKVSTSSADAISAFLDEQGLSLKWILETHAHADHLSAAPVLKKRHGARIAIGAGITEVQEVFKGALGLPDSFRVDGSQFDHLLLPGEALSVGALTVVALSTPGHTRACMTYQIGDALFTGDALFIDDYGTGRCDFPAGSAADLYDSITKTLYQLPDETRVFPAHDYQPGGRELRFWTTIGESKKNNPQLNAQTQKEVYVEFRNERDKQLQAPRLLWPSIQVNIAGGELPKAESNGRRYLKVPIFES